MHRKAENFSSWYSEVLLKAELIDYYDISGCYILRPWAFSMWEVVQQDLDKRIKSMGVKNCYFPLFVSEGALNAEKEHVEGFTPEVAWVTRSGSSNLTSPIAIRPTSETVIYPYMSKWIRSHRDLPLKINQWCNVIRWEFKHPTPFLRTREFLWQEGHTAHEKEEAARAEVLEVLDMYADVYKDLLAVPVIKGEKTRREKFAGADYTMSTEAFIPATGRGIQAATSHGLGQNFAKIFKIEFENESSQKCQVWQNCWGFTTRSLGIMIMLHGDDQGLVIPPRVAPVQVVLIPIMQEDCNAEQMKSDLVRMEEELKSRSVRTVIDDSSSRTPGWKYNHWEMKGVPLRLEYGPKDMQAGSVRLVRRDNRAKFDVSVEQLGEQVEKILQDIQQSLYESALRVQEEQTRKVTGLEEFMEAIGKGMMAVAPSCNREACEEAVEQETDAMLGSLKALCIPSQQDEVAEGTRCFACDQPATCHILWGKSY
ncbi:hypothetical protein GUITHDRAFT_81499 [Guillardia theta CCMP2712]|uniref:proline--tRNA ligase n=1 Tax=Guillardia theta (strain CCMP2712) TaxID=905079 RepID=L1IBU9_GUITC|nr:hypothetical protein GUITHDRAFT_81499 [Guillardia theta CCMP2712]EKX33394.1 hypothetical protein GUITHDRAFT_81499 [Guillardia theta CCMP2712]|eukprot:XP_005820374.1 hypothetical protein GUITHDRAFT_81499 [Guillardia theta CCMP2712]